MIRWVRRAAVVIALVVGLLATASLEAGASPLTPSEPRNLRATSGEPVTLVWDVPEANGATVTEYRVYRATASGAVALHGTTEERQFTDPVLPGESYYYAVSAVGIDGSEGRRSSYVQAGSLLASAPTVWGTSSNDGRVRQVHFQWQEPAYTGGSPITEYRVYNLGGELLGTASGEARELTITTDYENFSLTAVNAHGEGRHAFVDVAYTSPSRGNNGKNGECENLHRPEYRDCWG